MGVGELADGEVLLDAATDGVVVGEVVTAVVEVVDAGDCVVGDVEDVLRMVSL